MEAEIGGENLFLWLQLMFFFPLLCSSPPPSLPASSALFLLLSFPPLLASPSLDLTPSVISRVEFFLPPLQLNPSRFLLPHLMTEVSQTASNLLPLAHGRMLHFNSLKNGAIDERRDSGNTIVIIFAYGGLKPVFSGLCGKSSNSISWIIQLVCARGDAGFCCHYFIFLL